MDGPRQKGQSPQALLVPVAAVKLGLLYAFLPLSWGIGEMLWHRKGADSAMMWMSVASGIVFGVVVLAYSQGFAAGRAACVKSGEPREHAEP